MLLSQPVMVTLVMLEVYSTVCINFWGLGLYKISVYQHFLHFSFEFWKATYGVLVC